MLSGRSRSRSIELRITNVSFAFALQYRALRVAILSKAWDSLPSIALFLLNNMANSSNTYRGHTIEKAGHGKRTLFTTTINEKSWSTTTLSLAKAGIDTWIDGGEEPEPL